MATLTATRVETRFYEPELDLLRFCAFVSVFCFHAIPSDYSALVPALGSFIPALLLAVRNSMSFGVCMFFLLSSYLITKLLIIERQNTGAIHLKAFYLRRILRIWPLYLLFLMAMWVLSYLNVFYPIEPGRMLALLFFAGNIYCSIHGFTYNPILPLWTISIEEQFYIVWPPLVRAARGSLRGAAVAVIIVSILATAGLSLLSTKVIQMVWTNSLVHFQFFALGALVALRFSKRVPKYPLGLRLGMAGLGIVFVLIAGGPLHINSDALPPVPVLLLTSGYEVMALGVVLIFLAFLGATQGVYKIPSFLTYLGKISYGLYVFHDLSLQLCGLLSRRYGLQPGFRLIGGACLTLLLSMLSYRYLEKPFLMLKDKFSLVPARSN